MSTPLGKRLAALEMAEHWFRPQICITCFGEEEHRLRVAELVAAGEIEDENDEQLVSIVIKLNEAPSTSLHPAMERAEPQGFAPNRPKSRSDDGADDGND